MLWRRKLRLCCLRPDRDLKMHGNNLCHALAELPSKEGFPMKELIWAFNLFCPASISLSIKLTRLSTPSELNSNEHTPTSRGVEWPTSVSPSDCPTVDVSPRKHLRQSEQWHDSYPFLTPTDEYEVEAIEPSLPCTPTLADHNWCCNSAARSRNTASSATSLSTAWSTSSHAVFAASALDLELGREHFKWHVCDVEIYTAYLCM